MGDIKENEYASKVNDNENYYENWKADSNGNIKADLLKGENLTYEKWEDYVNGNKKANLLKIDSLRYEKWEEDKEGNNKAELLILENLDKFYKWRYNKIEKIQYCEKFVKNNGETYFNYSIDKQGNTKCKYYEYDNLIKEDWFFDNQGNQRAKIVRDKDKN